MIDRCNLTILSEPGQEDLGRFLADQGVTVVASLPCYSADNVDRQRGSGVFARSIAALRQLNALGYGHPGGGLLLHLVYNPQGPTLPPPQAQLEAEYRRVLAAEFGVVFTSLYALANMPIQRFASWLQAQGKLEAYQALLQNKHCGANLERVMCRSLISVDWQGWLYDCDFNLASGLPMGKRKTHVSEVTGPPEAGTLIMTADHCYTCTVGAGFT